MIDTIEVDVNAIDQELIDETYIFCSNCNEEYRSYADICPICGENAEEI